MEPPASEGIPEQEQHSGYQQGNDEQEVGPSPLEKETEQTLSQRMQNGEERQPSYQQGDGGQGNGQSYPMAIGGEASEISCPIPEMEETAVAGHCLSAHERQPVYQWQGDDGQDDGLSYPMAIGGQASEIFCPIPEIEEVAGHGLNTHERQPVNQENDGGRSNDLNHSLLNGGEVVPKEESLSIQESGTCQLVNGQQQQPRYQLSAQANGLSHPTQEMGLDASQGRDRQEVRHPIQETGRFAGWTPDEHEELPPCQQQRNGVDMNGVSSTGQAEQAAEHNCSRQELQLWKQELDRQADVTYCMPATT